MKGDQEIQAELQVKVAEVLAWLSQKIRIRMTELNLSRQALSEKAGMSRERE